MNRAARNQWVACPPGEFETLAARLRGRKQRRTTLRALTAAALVLVMGLGAWLSWTARFGPQEFEFAGLRCSEVLVLVEAYAAGELEPETTEQVRSHVDRCPHCNAHFDALGLLSRMLRDRGGWFENRLVCAVDSAPIEHDPTPHFHSPEPFAFNECGSLPSAQSPATFSGAGRVVIDFRHRVKEESPVALVESCVLPFPTQSAKVGTPTHCVSSRDFEQARQVHESLLPRSMSHPKIDIDVRFRPSQGLGGDYCQAVFVGEKEVYLTMCDAVGHGLTAAMLAGRVSMTVRGLVESRLSPRAIVEHVDRLFCKHFDAADLLLSFLAARIDLDEGTLTFSGAGHPGPLVVRGAFKRVESWPSQNLMIGVEDSCLLEPAEQTLSLQPGDRVALFTDGVFEIRGPFQSLLGTNGLAQILAQAEARNVFDLGDHIFAILDDYQANGQEDDQTLILAELRAHSLPA